MLFKCGVMHPDVVEANYQKVSYTTINGGCGIGRLIGSRVWRKRRDGYYTPVLGVSAIFRDDGAKYAETLDRRLSTTEAIDGAVAAIADELNRR